MKAWKTVLIVLVVVVAIGLATAAAYASTFKSTISNQYATSNGVASNYGGYPGGIGYNGMMGGYGSRFGGYAYGSGGYSSCMGQLGLP